MRDHEKFLAFLALGAAVLLLVGCALIFPPEKDQIIRILDTATGGFLLALGSAANALFRIGTPADEEIKHGVAAAVVQNTATASGQPQEVKVVNPPSDPANVQESPAAPSSAPKGMFDD